MKESAKKGEVKVAFGRSLCSLVGPIFTHGKEPLHNERNSPRFIFLQFFF